MRPATEASGHAETPETLAETITAHHPTTGDQCNFPIGHDFLSNVDLYNMVRWHRRYYFQGSNRSSFRERSVAE